MSSSSSTNRASVFVEGVGNDVCCPFVDHEDNLFFVLQESSEIIALDPSGQTEVIHCTNGQPSGAAFDDQGILYVADFAHCAVLSVPEAGNDQQESIAEMYENIPLKGPNSICTGSRDCEFDVPIMAPTVCRDTSLIISQRYCSILHKASYIIWSDSWEV